MSPFVHKIAFFCKHVVYKVKKNKVQVTTGRKFLVVICYKIAQINSRLSSYRKSAYLKILSFCYHNNDERMGKLWINALPVKKKKYHHHGFDVSA